MPFRSLRSGKLQITNHKSQISQSGYMLITLMLMVALAALALLAVLPDMAQQIRRDQEEEMCHRGTQYMRAIQHFNRKFGRYPTRVEELEDTNHLRFLRKRYKDPLLHDQQGKEKDFKLLHMQDISMNNGPSLGQLPGMGTPNSGPGNPLVQQNPNGPALGGGGAGGGTGSATTGTGSEASKDAEDESDSPTPQANSSSSPTGSSPTGNPVFNSGSTTGTGLNGTVFGGGPILGVASTSKGKTIREYNKKNHYNDWIFIYDSTSDTGGLLVGPWQTPQTKSVMPGATPAGQLTPGAQQPQGFGQPFGGGQSQGLQPPQQQPQAPQNQDTPNQQ